MVEARRNWGFAAGSKFSYCFEVITIINTKTVQTQMHFPAFLGFVCSLGWRQSSCRSGCFSLLLPMSSLRDLWAFSAPLWLEFFISAVLAINSYPSVIKACPHLLFPAHSAFPRTYSPFGLIISSPSPLLSTVPSLVRWPQAASEVIEIPTWSSAA